MTVQIWLLLIWTLKRSETGVNSDRETNNKKGRAARERESEMGILI